MLLCDACLMTLACHVWHVAQVKGLVASAATQLSMEEEEGAAVAGGAAEESTAATQVGREGSRPDRACIVSPSHSPTDTSGSANPNG